MAFPVDNLTNVDHESLEQAAEEYMSQLPYRTPENLVLPNSKQVEIGICNVSFVPLYGTDTEKKLLALFSPDDSVTVLGLYLLGKWWGVEGVLKTADPSRTGLIKVSTLGERIVLYVLNRIVLRNEKSGEDAFFLCHGEHESAKILWKDGEAVGFYSFKPKGSLCRNFVTQCYQLPVVDTVFVRKCHRGKGHGVKILEDFVGSFRNENIGFKFPLSEAMYKVCEKYLRIYPADKEFLWEVEKTGGHFQRTLIVNRLQTLKLTEEDHVVSKLNFEEEDAASMEIQITQIQETTESTTEIVEETITDITKEVDDIPVISRGRSSNLKRRGIRENSEERLSKNIIRVEDIEAGIENPIEATTLDSTFSVKASETVIRSTTDTVTATVTRISHLTTAGEIKEFEVVKEHTVEIEGACIGCVDQSQLQSVVDVEIVKMSTGNEEEQHENLENSKKVDVDKYVSETEKGEINQMLDKPAGENTASEAAETFNSTETLEEMTELPEIHAKPSEKEQVYWDVEITEKKERAENEVMEDHGKDLTDENRSDNIATEKCEAKDEDVVLQQSVEVKGQTEMEVVCTEEVLCEQQKQSEAETEVSEPNQRKTSKDTLFEKAKKNKLGPDGTEQVFTQSKLTQKRTSAVTPSRRSKRLRHESVETNITTKSVKTTPQRSKRHSKAVIQEKESEEPVDEPEHDRSEFTEESSVEHKAETETGVKEVTVETVSTMDNEIKQVEKILDVVPELVDRAEKDHEEAPQESSGEPPVEVQEVKTTIEELEERMDYSTVTLSEAKVALVDDNHGEMDNVEQDELKDTVSFEQQTAEVTLRVGEQENTLDIRPIEELLSRTESNVTAEQSTAYKEQENKPELKNTDGTVLSEDEKTETEHSKKDEQDSYEGDKQQQSKQDKKKGLTDIPSRSTRHRDQPVALGVTRVRRSTQGKAVIQQVEYVEPQSKAKFVTEESLEMDEVIAENVRPEKSEMANTSVDETTAAVPGSSELVKATETYDKEQAHEIVEATEGEVLPVEAENDDTTEKGVKEIKKTRDKGINLAGEMDRDMSSLAQAPVSTDKRLRSRTIKVTSTPRKKSERFQKQVDDVDVEHQEIHTVVSENKTEISISMTEDRPEVTDEDVNKMGNKAAMLAELEPVEETDISTNECDKTSATTDETVNAWIPISTTETSVESLDKTSNTNVEETTFVETKSSEILIGVGDTLQNIQIVEGSEEVPLVEAKLDEDVEKEDSTPVIKLQKATVLLVDLNQLSQNRDDEGKIPDVLRHFKTEEQLKLDETEKSGKESQEDEQKEQQTYEDPEKIHEEEKMEDTVVEDDKLDKPDEEQMLTKDQNKDEELCHLSQEKAVWENLEDSPVTTERSLRQRTIKVQSTSKRKSRRMQKQKAETLEDTTEIVLISADKGDQVGVDDKEEAPDKLTVKATEKGIHEEDVAEKGLEKINKMNKETSLVGTKDTNEEALQMREEATPELQENHPLAQNEKETAETEKPMEVDSVVSKKQENILEGAIIQVEEEVSQVECIEQNQSDYKGTTRRSLGLSKKSGQSTQKTRKSTRLHKVASESMKKVDVSRDEYEETSATTEETVNVSVPVIIVKTNLKSLDEIANKNVEESPAVKPETSELLMSVEIDDKEEAPQTAEEVPLDEAEPDEEAEHNDDTPVIQLQNSTVVLIDLNKLYQNTEGESHSPEVPTHSQTEEVDKSVYSENQLCIVRSDEKEQQELQIDTEKIPEPEKNEPNKQEVTFEGPNPTEHWEGRINVIDTEIVEDYRVVTSGEHPEATKVADKTNVIQETEKDQDVALKEKQADSEAEMSSLEQEAAESIQEILEEEAPVSIERSLRRRTIHIQSTPRKKSRRVQKQEAEAFEDKSCKVTVTRKGVEHPKKDLGEKDDKEKTSQTLNVEATDEEIPLVEEEPKECITEKVVEELNKMENKETNLVVTDTDEEAPDIEKANLVQQENEPLVINEENTTETEKSIEMYPVVSKGQPYIVEETAETMEEVPVEETEPDDSIEKYDSDMTPVQQNTTVVLVDLKKLSQNTEGETEIPEVPTHSQTEENLKLDQLSNLRAEEEEQQELQIEKNIVKTPEEDTMVEENIDEKQNEKDKQDLTFEGQKLTDDVEGQNDAKEREHPETTTMADKSNKIQEAEKDQDDDLKEKHVVSEAEMSGLAQKAAESVQEILEKDAPVSIERSLRRRTIQIQSTPRKKSRRVEKQEAEAFEDKSCKVTVTRKGVERPKKHLGEKDKTSQTLNVEATDEEILLVEEEPKECVTEKVVEEINKMENKETNLVVTDTDEEAPDMEEANLVQQENEPLVINEEKITETEKSIEMDPVVSKGQPYIVEGTAETVEEVPVEEAEPNDSIEKYDSYTTPEMQQQNATVVLLDLKKLSQNTEGESDTPEAPTHSQTGENLELDQLSNLMADDEELQIEENIVKTPEEDKMVEENRNEKQNEPDKQDLTFEGQQLTEDVEGQNDVIEREHPEATTMADKSNIIQEAEKDQDDDLKEKHVSKAEVSGLAQKAAESVQEILEEEAPVSIERSLRRRTIQIQSTPRKKSRRVDKQEAEASEGKIGKAPITRKVIHEESVKVDDKGKTLKKSTVEVSKVIPLIKPGEPRECAAEKVAEEMENREINLVVTKDTCEEAIEMKGAANVEQQESYPLAVNDKETEKSESEKPIEIDEDPVFSKDQRSVVEGTTIHLVEKASQVKSTENNQSDHEGITRRSLRLSAKSDRFTKKTRKSKRLHNVGLELENEADMSIGKSDETSATTEETILESLNKTVNMNVIETPAVEYETFELPMGVEIVEEAPHTVKLVPLKEAEPDEGAEENDNTSVIQLQNATVVLVDLNKRSQNTEGESDSPEVSAHSQSEDNTELDKPVDSEHQLCIVRSEEKEQLELHKEDDTEKAHEEEHTVEEQNEPMTFEGRKPTEYLEGQIDVQSTKIVVEIIHEHVQEATTMADKANIFQEREKDQNIALKDKHTDSDVEINYLAHEATEAVQEILEEEATVSTERSLRRRTIQIQSPLKRKSRHVQKQEAEAFEDKTGKVPITGKAKEMHQEGSKIDCKEETSQKSSVEETSAISLVEVESEDCAAENVIKEINEMENKETNLGNEEAPEMGREEAIFEQQENESLIESETENLIETDEVSVVSKEQTCIIEEISVQSELDIMKEADMSRSEDTLSMSAETVEVYVPSITEEINLNIDRDIVLVSRKVETNSDEQETDTSNDRGKVDEALHDISTGKEEYETGGSIKTTENEIEETLKVQEEEKAGEKTDQEQEENVQDEGEIEIRTSSVEENATQQEKAVEDNVLKTYPSTDCKSTVVEGEIALERTDQEASLITRRSLRSRTVTVQSTPRRISKRLHRLEVESEKESKDKTSGNENDSLPQSADDLNIPVEIESDTLNAPENIVEFEKIETKEQEDIIKENTEEKGVEIGTRNDTVAEGKEIQENTDQDKTQDERDIQVPKQDEEEVSSVQDEEKPLQEIEYEGVAGVQGSPPDLEETAVNRRTLRKRATVEAAAPRKSKRLCKQAHDDHREQVKEAVMGLIESVEVTFTTDHVEGFEASSLGEEIQRNAEGTTQDKCTKSGESQEEHRKDRVNITQADEDNEEENNKELEKTNEILEEVIEQHVEAEEHLESSANEGFTLELEAEESSDLENNKADEESRVAIETPKVAFTSADKSGEVDENISDNDDKGLSIVTHFRQSRLATASARRKSMRLQIVESKKITNESDSEESEVQQTAKHQRKRKAITDSTPSRRSKRYARAKNI